MNGRSSPLLWVGAAFLVANSSYLSVAGGPGSFYLANLVIHLVLGFGLLPALFLWWRRQSGSLVHLGVLLLVASAVAGTALLILGNRSSLKPLLWAHIGLSIAGLVVLVAAFAARSRGGLWKASAVGLVVALLVPAALRFQPQDEASSAPFVNPAAPGSLAESAMGGAEGPFYPSALSTSNQGLLPAEAFTGSQSCGTSGCHQEIYEQWSASPHRYSGLNNPWYRKTYENMVEQQGEEAARWCAGCHTPGLLVSGMMDRPLDEIADTPAATEGVSCTVCHGVSHIKSTMGQGDFELDVTPLHAMATSSNPLLKGLHDFLVRVDPEPHRRTFTKPLLDGPNSSEFCSVCHSAAVDHPLTDHGHRRIMADYEAWQVYGPAHQSIGLALRRWGPTSCNDCHMPPESEDGDAATTVRSHRFAAANTALPAYFGDERQLQAVIDYLKADQVTLDIFAMSKGQPLPVTAQAERNPELYAPLDRLPATLRRGESTRFDVMVKSNVGHYFPAGKFVMHDCWLELKAVDDRGKTFFWSGRLDEEGNVDPSAHFFAMLGIDKDGKRVKGYEVWNIQTYAYVLDIEANHSTVVRFRVEVPPEVGDQLTLTARLNYRKFRPEFTRQVFADLGKEAPELPVVAMAETSITLPVVDAGAELPDMSAPEHRPEVDGKRWLGYGYGLAASGDFLIGREAIKTGLELDPSDAAGWTLLGNLEWVAGDRPAAHQALNRALELDPEHMRARFFLGQTELSDGNYQAAIDHLSAVLERFPRDRMIWVRQGRAFLLNADYEKAVEALNKAAAVGTIDANPHFMLAMAHRALGNSELSEQHKRLYDRFNEDPTAEEVVSIFLKTDPYSNAERQILHEHYSRPLDELEPAGLGGSP